MITFTETGLDEKLITAVSELGFENPTPIQEATIPHLLENGHDLIALAQTGTGKTAAFGLPIIQQTDIGNSRPQTLVLCPTRELCMQITKDLKNYSKFYDKLNIVATYGGARIESQINSIKKGCHIIVGTPGRVLDLIRRRVLKIGDIRWLVLDEADEMLSMGFKDELDSILAETPKKKQTLLFSATMPREVSIIASKYMNSPDEISVGKKNKGAENVEHQYYMVQARDRYAALKRIADINPSIYGIVFCRTRAETKDVADKLMQDGYNADALHGDLSQAQRDLVMHRFRLKHLQLLVATDVAARGLDVNDLTHIINYNLPDEMDIYIHRSGRTGRAGKTGIAISIIHSREKGKIRVLEGKTGKKFERVMVPLGKDICEKQLLNYIDKVEMAEVDETQISEHLPGIYEKLEHMDRETLIKHFVSMAFNRFLSYYKNAPDLNVTDIGPKDRKRRNERLSEYSRFFINVGMKNDLNPTRLIGLINSRFRHEKVNIGKIDIMKKFSFFDIDSSYEDEVVDAFKSAKYNNMKVNVELVTQQARPKTIDRDSGQRKRKRRTKRDRH